MIQCRRAKFSDLDRPDVQALLKVGLLSGLSETRIEWPKVWGHCRQMLAGPHYAALAFKGDVAVAYLGAMRTPTWGARDRFTVTGWYSTLPGAGMRLFLDFMAHARAAPGVGDVLVTVNAPSAGLARILSRYGAKEVPSFLIET